MRKNLVKNVLRTSAFALACLALAGAETRAGVLHTYSTGSTLLGQAGTITGSGVTVDPTTGNVNGPISFTPVVSGSFTAPSAVSLGQFQVATLADGKEADYNNAKFTVTYNPLTVAGVNYPAGSAPITITGTLNGAITGSQSSVVATFDSITSPVFTSADGSILSTISVINNPLALVPASAGGITTVQAQVVSTDAGGVPVPAGGNNNVPEPTTFALLATSLVGLGLRHRLRAPKAA